jgi:23S rRNA pseudouridine2605 synthase
MRDPEAPTRPSSRIELDGAAPATSARLYLLLNKPRGLITSAADEQGRDTVYRCLADAGLPWLAPVGRLDRASEGLLLFTNDSEWAAALLAPGHAVPRQYHVQVAGLPDAATLARVSAGVRVEDGETLTVARAGVLRSGRRNAWLDVTLDEGRNRHLRRLLAAVDHPVLRLVRVALGPLRLGDLPKGAWRLLDADEVRRLAPPSGN